jgi:hypothetical protein
LICFLILILGRVVNAFLPLTLGALITTFDTPGVSPFPAFGSSPWPYLITYVLLRFLASSGGLAAIRDALWIPLMQYSDRSMSMLSFNHVLALSLSWHTKRKTGELLRILDRGSAINRVGELIGFTVIPALVDICVALVVFVVRFEPALGAVVGVVMGSYIWASVMLTRYRTRIRRRMNERDVVSAQCYFISSMMRVLIAHMGRSLAGSILIVSLIMRLSSISVGRSMRRRGMRRLLESIRLWRGELFVSVSVSSHFKSTSRFKIIPRFKTKPVLSPNHERKC